MRRILGSGLSLVVAVGFGTFTGVDESRARDPKASLGRGERAIRPTTGELFSKDLGVASVITCAGAGESCVKRIYKTSNAGRSWRDITPPEFPSDSVTHDVEFVSPRYGWLITNDCAAADAFLYRTRNGGATWQRTRVDAASCNAGARLLIDFVDRSHGWMVHGEPTSGGPAELRRTTDGGRTWSEPTTEPNIGEVRFRDRRHGFLTDYFFAPTELYASNDSGRTWARRRIKRPTGYSGKRFIDLPSFRGEVGILPVTYRKDRRKDIVFYKSRSEGRTWNPRVVLRPRARPDPGTFPLPSAIVTRKVWWAIAGRDPKVYVTTNGGRRWTKNETDLPSTGPISAIGPKTAWVVAFDEDRDRSFVYRTRDGGRSWRKVRISS